jgi:hypothetical protein
MTFLIDATRIRMLCYNAGVYALVGGRATAQQSPHHQCGRTAYATQRTQHQHGAGHPEVEPGGQRGVVRVLQHPRTTARASQRGGFDGAQCNQRTPRPFLVPGFCFSQPTQPPRPSLDHRALTTSRWLMSTHVEAEPHRKTRG